MIVSSPIGDLPFTPDRFRYRGGAVTLEGSMGAWPAQVHVQVSDVPAFARLLVPRNPAAVAIGLGIAGASLFLFWRQVRQR